MSWALLGSVIGVSAFGGIQEVPGTVKGRVLSSETKAPISGAAIEVRHHGMLQFLTTDDNGAYRATGLTPGPILVIARAIDRAPLHTTVSVPSGGEVPLDIVLELRPVLMPSIVASIEASRLPIPGLARGGFRDEGETELRALESSPGVSELGLSGGSSRPDQGDPTSVLYVRGAAADLKLVLLDGAPVYAPFHLNGLLDAFTDGVLDNASLYIGGTPARYDGGLSYVLDLDVREADNESFRTAGRLDLLGVSGRVEGPLGSHGRVLFSGRGLHGAGYPIVTESESDLPYGYGDLLGRIDSEIGPGKFSATGFWNRESVLLNIGKLEEAGAAETAYWGNLAGSTRYRIPIGSGALTFSGAYGKFSTGFPVPRPNTDGPVSFANALGQTARSRTEAFYESGDRDLRWAAGAGFDTHETVLDQRTVFGDTTAHFVGRANIGAAWGEVIWDLSPEVEVQAGIRTSFFAPENVVRFSPRATATWHINESADLRISSGRFFQIMRGPESILSSDLTGPTVGKNTPVLESDVPLSQIPILGIAGANHLVVGLENRLENGLEIGIEGYFKSFDDLPDAENLFSSGADLWVEATGGPIQGWIGYSLGWVWSDDSKVDTKFVGRQLLSGGLSTDIRNFNLALRLTYGAGLPFSSVSASRSSGQSEPINIANDPTPLSAISGAPDDSYLRVDVEISRRWVTRVGDSTLEIAPYLRVLNTLDRRDALFYQAGSDALTRPVPLASVPLLAVLGVAWSF